MTLAEFMLKLACDSDLLARFWERPDDFLDDCELTDRQKQLLLAGDLRELRVEIKAEFEIDGEVCAIITIYTIPTIYTSPPPDK